MKKFMLGFTILVVSFMSLCSAYAYDLSEFVKNSDNDKTGLAVIQGTCSGVFTITSTNTELFVSVNGIIDTAYLIPGNNLPASNIVDQLRGQLKNVYPRAYWSPNDVCGIELIAVGNTANIAVVAHVNGAETACGLIGGYTRVYATPPNVAPTVGGNPISADNPLPTTSVAKNNSGTICSTNPLDVVLLKKTYTDTKSAITASSATIAFVGECQGYSFAVDGTTSNSYCTICFNSNTYTMYVGDEPVSVGLNINTLLSNPTFILNNYATKIRFWIWGRVN